jgi:cellulose synthase/poly-beta-1,6-N-acetylglucosamine synthase-like glycosyltransferase
MAIISFILGIYLSLAAVYMLIFAIGAHRPNRKSELLLKREHSIAVLIPAYKEDAVIVDVAMNALNQNYTNYDVFIIADSLKKSTLQKLSEIPIRLVEVSFEKSTKAKALNAALDLIKYKYDMALVLDADNIMEEQFLKKINEQYCKGYEVIQTRRVAKNLNTNFAILDAVSEAINNNIYNLGQVNLGFSSRLVGSGMAFDYDLFKEMMSKAKAVGGFDKELELNLLQQGEYIHYVNDAILWDEKVSKGAVFGRQRTRWVAAQFYYLKLHAWPALKSLFTEGNIDYFNKICQMALPPRLLIPFFLAIGTVLNYLFCYEVFILWLVGLAANVIANMISIPLAMFNKSSFIAICSLPKAMFIMFFALFKMKNANKTFIHTPHGSQ